MQPIEVYKLLPRKNCGKCSAATCMAFAVQYLRRMLSLSECPELDSEGVKEIEAQLGSAPLLNDWKENRIKELINEIKEVNFSDIAGNIGAVFDSDTIKIKLLGTDMRLSPSGFQGEPAAWARLLTLIYIKQSGKTPLQNKWTNFRDLRGGSIKAEAFHAECELEIAKLLETESTALFGKLTAAGAVKAEGFSADHSFMLQAFPKIPLLILLWQPDDEFGADCKVLFDPSAVDYLDIESLCYLGDELIRVLK
jgi:hypothetical protein